MRLIDADATLLKMWNALYKLEDKIEQKNGLQPIRRLDVQAGFEAGQYEVANAPIIEERKKGKWIDRGHYCVCNQCGHTEQQFNGVEPIPRYAPYCAMCGADMREVKEDAVN